MNKQPKPHTKQLEAFVWEACYPIMPGPTPLLSERGRSEFEAVQNLKSKAEKDSLAQVWNDLINWNCVNNGVSSDDCHTFS